NNGETPIRPIESDGIHDYATDGRPVAANELGCRMDNDVRAPFERAAEVRRRKRVVHYQWEVVLVCDRRHSLDVQYVAAGVADRLSEERLRVRSDGVPPGVGVVRVDPGQFHAHLAEKMLELVDRPAVQRR